MKNKYLQPHTLINHYHKAFDLLFTQINNWNTFKNKPNFTPIELSWKDYICSDIKSKTNVVYTEEGLIPFSQVHFKIAELPEWIFGIDFKITLYDLKNINKHQELITCNFYASYEATTGKFKYWRSTIKESIKLDLKDTGVSALYEVDISTLLNFIKEEPALSFCRDYEGWNYNTSYHTREEAEKSFADYKRKKARAEELEIECNQKVYDWLAQTFKKELEEQKDFDEGKSTKEPNLFIEVDEENEDVNEAELIYIAPKELYKELSGGSGFYDLQDIFEDYDIAKSFDSLIKDCERLQEDNYVNVWCCPIDGLTIYTTNPVGFIRRKKRVDKYFSKYNIKIYTLRAYLKRKNLNSKPVFDK